MLWICFPENSDIMCKNTQSVIQRPLSGNMCVLSSGTTQHLSIIILGSCVFDEELEHFHTDFSVTDSTSYRVQASSTPKPEQMKCVQIKTFKFLLVLPST